MPAIYTAGPDCEMGEGLKERAYSKYETFFQFKYIQVHRITQVNRMSKSRRVLAIGGKQRSFGLHMVGFGMVLYHNKPH